MAMSFNVKPFERKVFEEVIFFLKYHQTPPSPLETEHRKKERKKYWKKGKREKEKRGRKRKAPRVSSNKGEVNILRGEKHFNFKSLLLMWFSPPSSYHFKNLFQNHWESFLSSFWTILYLDNIHDLSCTLSLNPWAPYM
jgi:hypothetical protein